MILDEEGLLKKLGQMPDSKKKEVKKMILDKLDHYKKIEKSIDEKDDEAKLLFILKAMNFERLIKYLVKNEVWFETSYWKN